MRVIQRKHGRLSSEVLDFHDPTLTVCRAWLVNGDSIACSEKNKSTIDAVRYNTLRWYNFMGTLPFRNTQNIVQHYSEGVSTTSRLAALHYTKKVSSRLHDLRSHCDAKGSSGFRPEAFGDRGRSFCVTNRRYLLTLMTTDISHRHQPGRRGLKKQYFAISGTYCHIVASLPASSGAEKEKALTCHRLEKYRVYKIQDSTALLK